MAYRAPLERVCAGNRTAGSNPALSVSLNKLCIDQFNFSCSLYACCVIGWLGQLCSQYFNIAVLSSLPALSSRRPKCEQKKLKCSKIKTWRPIGYWQDSVRSTNKALSILGTESAGSGIAGRTALGRRTVGVAFVG